MTRRDDSRAFWRQLGRRARAGAGAAICTVLLTAGCTARSGAHGSAAATASASAVATGSSVSRLHVGGLERTYRLHLPPGLPTGTRVPLVVMLHGGFGTAAQAEQTYGWDAEADRHAFAVAYPDGLDRAWAAGGGCCGRPAARGVDDVAFISAVVSDIEHRHPVDTRRIYATGISNGGLMAYRLACDTRLFAAIGTDSATQLGPCSAPAPISVLHIHGTADHNIPYQGGRGEGPAHIDGPAVPAVLAGWRTVDHCTPPTSGTSGTVTRLTAACPYGRAVELITVSGAGHQWPGSAPRTAVERLLGLDAPSNALNATDTFWSFFAAHPACPSP
ncbi:PHB depolymerase family esterase [Streptomyces coacervatus]|nr:PHB depolymerase family esterase [Streptomyces coacervatus]MDF2269693.1 PHB depolymerase family esterase [Streptomyces coacervatus]